MTTEKPKVKKKIVNSDSKFKGLDGNFYRITPKEKIFCEVWLETTNQTISALEAYDIKNKSLCMVRWTELNERDKIKRRQAEGTVAEIRSHKVRKVEIKAYLDKRLADAGYTGNEIWREHYKNIRQDRNLPAKNTAIDMYYKVKGEYKEKSYAGEIEAFFEGIRDLAKKNDKK